jgi:peptide-methionine (S)-S-oxide reductase
VVQLGEFYEAEDYHRQYFKNHPEAGYCQVLIEPKVEKLQKQFAALLKEKSK